MRVEKPITLIFLCLSVFIIAEMRIIFVSEGVGRERRKLLCQPHKGRAELLCVRGSLIMSSISSSVKASMSPWLQACSLPLPETIVR